MVYRFLNFSKYNYDEKSYILKLYYDIDNLEFIEEINFNPRNLKLRELNENEKKVLDLSFSYLHLVAGISYYKLLLPEKIEINTKKLNKDQKDFFDKLYLYGLGEFSYKNNLNLNEKINFPYSDTVNNEGININLKNNLIVPIGGGKDSLVSLEILKTLKDQKLYTFSVNTAKPIEGCVKLANIPNIIVNRKIAPLLLEINKNLEKYNSYNGHVPISSIITFISVSAGILYDCDTTIISNEKSANLGNIMHNGILVNHQWSKSFEAELMSYNFIKKYITPQYSYISLLRPIYEIHIAKLFAKIERYHSVFSSCNKNFKIIKDEVEKRWCCECDKCRFVFLILAPFIKKEDLIQIFGHNLLNDEEQLDGYKELTGFLKNKPFECVGEIEESILAFSLLKDSSFKNDKVVKEINEKISNKYNENEIKKLNNKYFSCDFEGTLLNDKLKNALINFIN